MAEKLADLLAAVQSSAADDGVNVTAAFDTWGNARFLLKTQRGRNLDVSMYAPELLELEAADVLETLYQYAWTIDQHGA